MLPKPAEVVVVEAFEALGLAAPLAAVVAALGAQTVLCCFQSAAWQGREQYQIPWHFSQRLRGPLVSASVFLHVAQA